jgi:hypothetical protein
LLLLDASVLGVAEVPLDRLAVDQRGRGRRGSRAIEGRREGSGDGVGALAEKFNLFGCVLGSLALTLSLALGVLYSLSLLHHFTVLTVSL